MASYVLHKRVLMESNLGSISFVFSSFEKTRLALASVFGPFGVHLLKFTVPTGISG